jgi:hypothetical protein
VRLAVLCVCACIMVWTIWTRTGRVSVIDPKFHVVRFRISKPSRGLALMRYLGMNVASPRWACSFLFRYRGDFDPEDLRHLKAFLKTSSGFSMEVPGHPFAPGPPMFTTRYLLINIPTNQGPFTLVFKLPSTDTPVATWKVGNLR